VISLLSGGIPDFKLDRSIVRAHRLSQERRPDRALLVLVKLPFDESQH